MPRYTLTKLLSGREIYCEVVEADSAQAAIDDALRWLTSDERTRITYTAELAPEPPRCPKCGSHAFQIVEDVPRMYRDHELVDGVLVFVPEFQEMCWDACGSAYQYLECRDCQTRMTDIPFAFDDPDGAHTGFAEDDEENQLRKALEECITDDGAPAMTDESRNAASVARRRLAVISALAREALDTAHAN